MKNNNVPRLIRFTYIFFHVISIFVIIICWLNEETQMENLIMSLSLIACMIMLNIMFFGLKHLWYNTNVLEDKIKQTFLTSKKEILYREVKFIYFIDKLIILSKDNEIEPCDKYSLIQKKRIKSRLKNDIIIWHNSSDKYFPVMLKDKCLNAKYIKIGKISKIIEDIYGI